MRKLYTTAKLEVILFNEALEILATSGMSDEDNYFVDPDSLI